MELCGNDWGCWMLWIDTSLVRWLQALASFAIACIAIWAPRRERQHQAVKESKAKLGTHIGILELLSSMDDRLKGTGKLLNQWINDKNGGIPQLKRIQILFHINESACNSIPLHDLGDRRIVDAVIELTKEVKLLILAIDEFLLSTNAEPADAPELLKAFTEEAAFDNLNTADLYSRLSKTETMIEQVMQDKRSELERLR
ncbi:hypothetical protein MWU49_09285 [Alcanivorax sp. S6407]|uniref:hypothetical protein n=1 Tax=Alcanivorax sp. S6407 TaxID=2926424 RepID=UPI001FF2012D|nr:hypothetical protein [Alcanivorax sp. S6407]MCK0153896.1 hypothetical protein [Alcanivorax sp. S6407]